MFGFFGFWFRDLMELFVVTGVVAVVFLQLRVYEVVKLLFGCEEPAET